VVAVVAALIGTAAAWTLVTRYMRVDFVFLPGTLTAVIAASIVAVVAIGLAGTWRALGHKPAPLLRNP
jgi:putative ABC transport system permease protein